MNFGDLFDSPWKILIVAVVIIVLFGSKKLPHAARSLGQSMRILKTEVQGLHEDDDGACRPGPGRRPFARQLTAAPAAADGRAASDQQSQIDALSSRSATCSGPAAMDTVPADAPRTQQPS